jgi:hypothetical protein
VPEFRFNWYTVTTADGTAEFIPDQAQPLQTRATSARPPTNTAVAPTAKIDTKSKHFSQISSTFIVVILSSPSTTPSSPYSSTSGAVPKTIPARSTSGSSATPSKLPSPTTAPSPAPKLAPKSAKGSRRKLRAHPEVNKWDLHLGRNLLLGQREFLKRCHSTRKSVGKAVQQTIEKVQKVAEEFPVISQHSSSSSMASTK